MKVSPNGIKFIAEHEGEILKVYKDPVGLPTLGVGHLLTQAELKEMPVGTSITKEQSREYLAKDLARFERAIEAAVKVPVNQNQFDALVSFAFNIGESAFKRSSTLRKLNEKNYVGAADAMLAWNKATNKKGQKVELPGLTRRRKEERSLFLTPSALVPAIDEPIDDLNKGINESATHSEGQAPTNSETKVEVSAAGAVSVEQSTGPPPPKERIAVVKSTPVKWYKQVTTKITGIVTGNALFQWAWGQSEKITSLTVPDAVWVIVSVTIAVGSLLWIIYEIVDTWRANRNQERIDDLLVKENSTSDNLVQLIPADELELYRAKGFKIITRGEKT